MVDPVPIPAAAARRLLSTEETNDLLQDLINEVIFLRGEKGQHLEKISNLERQVETLESSASKSSSNSGTQIDPSNLDVEGSAPECKY